MKRDSDIDLSKRVLDAMRQVVEAVQPLAQSCARLEKELGQVWANRDRPAKQEQARQDRAGSDAS